MAKRPSQSPDPAAAAKAIADILRAIRDGEVTAPPGLVNRLEGAYIALAAFAEGRAPTPQEFYGEGYVQHRTD